MISLIIQGNLAKKYWAKWESGLTGVWLKQDTSVHEVKVFQLWLHLCNALYVWQPLSYNIGNPSGLLEWNKCEVQYAGSSGCCTVNVLCCRLL